MASKGHLKAKFRVGSINGPINYTYGEKAFHAAAVPPAEKTRTKGNGWNGSTDRGEVLCLRRQRQLSAYDAPVYQYNFRAEVLPQPTPVYVPKPSHLEFDRRTFLERQSKGLITADGHRVARRPPARCMEMPVHPSIDPDARVAQHQLWDQGRRTAQQTLERPRGFRAGTLAGDATEDRRSLVHRSLLPQPTRRRPSHSPWWRARR